MDGAGSGQLEGGHATLIVADPFELATAPGESPIELTIIAVDGFDRGADKERVLAALARPLSWGGRDYDFVVLEPRRGGGLTQQLLLGESVECNALGATAADVERGSPWGADTWRGGLGALGTLRMG